MESLGKLGRSEAQLHVYRNFMAGVRGQQGRSLPVQRSRAVPLYRGSVLIARLPLPQVRNDYSSVADFIKVSVFEAAVHCKGG